MRPSEPQPCPEHREGEAEAHDGSVTGRPNLHLHCRTRVSWQVEVLPVPEGTFCYRCYASKAPQHEKLAGRYRLRGRGKVGILPPVPFLDKRQDHAT